MVYKDLYIARIYFRE